MAPGSRVPWWALPAANYTAPLFKREQGVEWDQVRVRYGCRVGAGSSNGVDLLNSTDRLVSTSSFRSQRERYVARFGANF